MKTELTFVNKSESRLELIIPPQNCAALHSNIHLILLLLKRESIWKRRDQDQIAELTWKHMWQQKVFIPEPHMGSYNHLEHDGIAIYISILLYGHLMMSLPLSWSL